VIDGLERQGAPQQVIDAVRQRLETHDRHFEVYEENWPSLELFLEVQSQWRLVAGMSGASYLGLDYQGVEAFMRLKPVPRKDRAGLFQDLLIMEREALRVLNKPKD
jgi:hypothetical protein